MAIGKYSPMFVLMILIGILYNTTGLSCPSYAKHEAIREGLLSNQSICRAKDHCFDTPICLNGEKTEWAYCSTGFCNLFGYNCDGHCLSGDDLIHGEKYLECDVSNEIKKLCEFYYKYEPLAVLNIPKLDKLCPTLKDALLYKPFSIDLDYECKETGYFI